MATRSKSSSAVMWELSEEGRVVVEVDAPLRPFGALPTPARGIRNDVIRRSKDETEPDGDPLDGFGDFLAEDAGGEPKTAPATLPVIPKPKPH